MLAVKKKKQESELKELDENLIVLGGEFELEDLGAKTNKEKVKNENIEKTEKTDNSNELKNDDKIKVNDKEEQEIIKRFGILDLNYQKIEPKQKYNKLKIAIITITALAVIIIPTSILLNNFFIAKHLETEFKDFMKTYDKQYDTPEEYKKRLEIYKKNLKEIEKLKNKVPYKVGVNEFTDLTSEEFLSMNKDASDIIEDFEGTPLLENSKKENKEEYLQPLDIRDEYVNKPVSQGRCGSCYCFTSIANVEGFYTRFISKNKEKIQFSQQQILDCKENSCGGGTFLDVYRHILKNKYLMKAEDYPYTSKKCSLTSGKLDTCPNIENCKSQEFLKEKGIYIDDIKCMYLKFLERNDTNSSVVNKLDYTSKKVKYDIKRIYESIEKYGPLYVSVDASVLHYYKGGIVDLYYDELKFKTNHAVNLVGYGYDEEEKKHYWLLKNSWGTKWGENGYFRIEHKLDYYNFKYISYFYKE